MAQGVLTGKYLPGQPPPEGSRATDPTSGHFTERLRTEEILTAVQGLRPLAEQAGLSMAQLAVAWVLQNPNVSSAIIGATRPEQVARERQGRRRRARARPPRSDRHRARRRRAHRPAHDRLAREAPLTWGRGRWRYERADGTVLAVAPADAPESFPSQADAESWIGEQWRELLEAGVDAVTLLEDDRVVYGPMSLHPAS